METRARYEEVVEFLSRPASFGGGEAITRIETHAARVFLAGNKAIKIKKPLRFAYLDFSTLDKRCTALARELELNRPNAPEIYDALVPIVRRIDGNLALGGEGEPVEWALVMHRFDRDQLLDRVAGQGAFTPDLAHGVADAVLAAHGKAPVATGAKPVRDIQALVGQLSQALADHAGRLGRAHATGFRRAAEAALARARTCLERRAAAGFVRRCHGDLHLGNIVLIEGRPVLFDALEFDESLATIDVLYDLAFLLMDLVQHDQRPAANQVLNRYLYSARGHDEGLIALPLFLGLRAGVRAMVIADRAAQAGAPPERWQDASAYLRAALVYFDPPPPRMVVIAGFSGTGKTTLAAAIAPDLGPIPGAVHVRSDVERKALFGVAETVRLEPSRYDAATTRQVYRRLEERAGKVLEAGHAVVVDAVFARSEERHRVEAIARRTGAAFTGLWLTAASERLVERVSARRDDASDATPQVVAQQIDRGAGPIEWPVLDTSGKSNEVIRNARRLLGLSSNDFA